MTTKQTKRPFDRIPFMARMVGAVRLHSPTYHEVKNDRTATRQAIVVVVIAALATGFGIEPGNDIAIWNAVNWIMWWGIWVFLIYVIGPNVLKSPNKQIDWGELARTTGFAQSPLVFMSSIGYVGNFGPNVYLPIFILIALLWFAAMVIAIKVTIGYKTLLGPIIVASTFLINAAIIQLIYA